MHIFLDIETIPGQTPGLKDQIAETITPPGSMKKAETIAKWEAEQKPKAVKEAWLKTALSGLHGEIVAISWAVDEDDPESVYRGLGAPEAQVLQDFFRAIGARIQKAGQNRHPVWVGHNIREFDLRFLYQRAVILNVPPAFHLPHDVHPSSDRVFDTMTAWAGYRGTVKLDDLARALGLKGKSEGMDGSKVWEAIQTGEEVKVARYCEGDVRLVRDVYRRLTFANGLLLTPSTETEETPEPKAAFV